nr:L,D-transpeptidase [Aestuariivirga sp. YIM B02566]
MTSSAEAKVSVRIDISSQTMSVSVNGWPYATWRVSTARSGYWTPRGSYRPFLLKRMHYSRKYDNSPMPHSIFFKGGYAIHGTGYVRALGRPASHGCIRLAPGNAARLYSLVQQYGKGGTRITITN